MTRLTALFLSMGYSAYGDWDRMTLDYRWASGLTESIEVADYIDAIDTLRALRHDMSLSEAWIFGWRHSRPHILLHEWRTTHWRLR